MSLFVGFLALPNPVMQQEIKLGIITGSVLSALYGALVFKYTAYRKEHHLAASAA
jgi:NhaA family Na+:H+ antiporter